MLVRGTESKLRRAEVEGMACPPPLPPTTLLGGPGTPGLRAAAILPVLPGPSLLPLPSLRPHHLQIHPLVRYEGEQQPGGEPGLLPGMLQQNRGESV